MAALAGGVLWYQSEQVPQLGRVVSTGKLEVGGPFRLTDQNGQKRSDADFRGKYMLIYFGYSFCPDVCPTTLAVMSEALSKMGTDAKRIVPVFITTDPERDTPKVLKDYMNAFGPEFVGLTGSAAEIREVEKKFRVYAQKQPLEICEWQSRRLRRGPFQCDLSGGAGRQDGQLLHRNDPARRTGEGEG